jgi:hypothetical protein
VRDRILLGFVAGLMVVFSAAAQSEPPEDAPNRAVPRNITLSVATTPETPEALKTVLQQMFMAEKTQDAQEGASYYSQMAIPDHAEWFAKTFGEAEGAAGGELQRLSGGSGANPREAYPVGAGTGQEHGANRCVPHTGRDNRGGGQGPPGRHNHSDPDLPRHEF